MPVIFLKADAFLHSIVIFIPVKDDITLRMEVASGTDYALRNRRC